MSDVKRIVLGVEVEVSGLGKVSECWLITINYRAVNGVDGENPNLPYPGITLTKPKATKKEDFLGELGGATKTYLEKISGPRKLEGRVEFTFSGKDGLAEAETDIRGIVSRAFSEVLNRQSVA